MDLKMPLSRVLRTTKKHLHVLKDMGIETAEDLLLHLPRVHEDLSQVQTLRTAPFNEKVTVRGVVTNLKRVFTRRRKQLITAVFVDSEEGRADVVWFNQPHIMRMLKDGDEVVLMGKVLENGYKLQMQSPQFELAGKQELVHAGRLVPIYPQHDVVNTKWLREKVVLVKDAIEYIGETLPEDVVQEEHLMSRKDAIRALHFPDNPEQVRCARERIAFEEMYRVQERALRKKKEWQEAVQDRLKVPMDIELIKSFFSSLKFTPTNSQKIAIYEILKDMEGGRPMSRLLEGDVGSGKTLVATAVMANVLARNGQCALMVPTEVLAKQHGETVGRLLRGSKVALLTGSMPRSQSLRIKQGLSNRTIDLVIGTHALIEEDVRFKNLVFVVIDEQHRFGVIQREKLRQKGSPHALYMTATPIPRTLALTAYGHHDLSVLTEKPGNRIPVHTKVVRPRDRRAVEAFINREIEGGRQVFVICPLIADSGNEEMTEVKSVQAEIVRLQTGFPGRRIAMLHGKMVPKEKEETMRRFRNCEFDLLVSTSVIEVGIDIPNASIMIIEGAERFGLAQLHQFRGRVGRGAHKSHCFLFTTPHQSAAGPQGQDDGAASGAGQAPHQSDAGASHDRSGAPSGAGQAPTFHRLKAMEQVSDGFLLAEIDLKIRGPGELYGVRQSGIPEISLAHLLNPELVVRARRAAQKALSSAT